MIPAVVTIRRPLVAALAGLLLVSACASASETSSTPTTPASEATTDSLPDTTEAVRVSTNDEAAPTTTETPAASAPAEGAADSVTSEPVQTSTLPPVATAPASTEPPTTPPATEPAVEPLPVAAVDVSSQSIFGFAIYVSVDVEAVAADVSVRLGSPTTDTGWQPMAAQPNCAGSTEFRVVWWGDFRMTFERYRSEAALRDELSAWTVGDPTLVALSPIGAVPTPSPSNVVTLEGIGIGSTLAEVETAWANVNNGGEGRLVVIDDGGSLVVGVDDAGRVIGFGNGPFDCPVDEVR